MLHPLGGGAHPLGGGVHPLGGGVKKNHFGSTFFNCFNKT